MGFTFPKYKSNLLSVGKATQNGCAVIFEKEECYISNSGKTILEGKLNNNLNEINFANDITEPNIVNISYGCDNSNCIETWHQRMGHRSYQTIREMIANQLVTGITINNYRHANNCEVCIRAKSSETPYPKKAQYRATRKLELIHSDVCGPMQTPTIK